MIENENHNEQGMLTVEATLAFVPFLMVVLGIISFINIYMVHNRVQYAIFQVGSELSAYTYLYQALSIRSADMAVQGDADRATQHLDELVNLTSQFLTNMVTAKESYQTTLNSSIGNVADNVNNSIDITQETIESGGAVVQQGSYMIRNPETILQGIVYTGIENGISALKAVLTELLAGGLANLYIQQHNMTAQEYLASFGVKNATLDYEASTMFDDDDRRMIDIVVNYDIEIHFFKLFLEDPSVTIAQRVVIPAWLDGDGDYYEE